MKSSSIILSKKYAQAFMNVYEHTLSLRSAERIAQVGAYFKHNHLSLFSMYSLLPDFMLKKEVSELFAELELDHIFEPLIDLLITHKRLFLLPEIMKQLFAIYLEKTHTLYFTIESMPELTELEEKNVVDYLEKRTKKTVLYSAKKNKALIAGINVYSHTVGFEYSIRKQLHSLKKITHF